MRVAFRVDASSRIGSGHLMRCLALADGLLARGHRVAFISRDLVGHMNDLLESRAAGRGFDVVRLPAPAVAAEAQDHRSWLGVPTEVDAAETAEACKAFAPDWLVVDHYALDARWHRRLRGAVQRIMVIDDLADREYDCDLLLDQNLAVAGAVRYRGRIGAATSLLLGPRYALQRPEFAQLRARAQPRERVRRVAVFFGGVDEPRLTERTAQAFRDRELRDLELDVFVGAGNARAGAIGRLVARLPRARLHAPGSDFATLLAQADLAIGAGGGTMWERCTLGVPAVVVSIAANQEPGCRAAAQAGAIAYLGRAEEVSGAAIAGAVRLLRDAPHIVRQMSAACLALSDGDGVGRVVRAIERVGALTLRRATDADCDRVLAWRNDPEVRAMSLDSREIDAEAHRRWFAAVVADGGRALLIAEAAGRPVGVLRFDRAPEQVARVSIYRVPGEVAEGIGTEMLRAGAEWIAGHWPDVRGLEAEIRTENARSIAVFERAGYAQARGIWFLSIGGSHENRVA